MNVNVITDVVEKYINGDVEDFEWDIVEAECKGEKKYFYNLVERVIKNYNQYVASSVGKLDLVIAIRCFLITFKTSMRLPDGLIDEYSALGFHSTVDGKVYASVEAPSYISTKFVSDAFQLNGAKIKGEDTRYLLKTNNYVNDLTEYEYFNSEAQKLCVMGVLRLPEGYSSLVVLPTGGGKSLVTQTLAYKEEGLTIVIVPTISLAIDQEIAAKESIQYITNREIFSYSSGSANGTQIIDAIKEHTARLLFISPEALIKNEDFMKIIIEANDSKYLKNIVIDEAHIVIEWGDLFRTDYQTLEPWRKKLISTNPELRTILLSATIDNNTGRLLKNMFSTDDKWVEFRCDALRKEPRYCVVNCKSHHEKKKRILEMVNCLPHPLIIYTMRPDRAEKIKEWIIESGYEGVETFTGETNTKDRDELIRGWKKNEFDIMVATAAFGMGVDKPDVRTVIHEYVPDNPSMYYQELGRGGRDGLPSLSVLCIFPDDDLEFSKRNKVLNVDKALGRWESMYRSPNSKRVEDHVFIDTKIKPSYNLNYKYDVANARDVQWNIYLLLLFRRYNLINIMDVEYVREEERYVFKIKLIDNRLAVVDANTEKLLTEIRAAEKNRYSEDFEVLKKAILTSDKTCFSEMFIATYPRVSEYCAGCGSHEKILYDDDNRFVLNKRVDISISQADAYINEDSLVISADYDLYIEKLAEKGIINIISDIEDIKRMKSERPEYMQINFYEFRRLYSSKNMLYLNGICVVCYSRDQDSFRKEFSVVQKYANAGFKIIHIVPEDFEVDTTGKRVSAYIGNNITDSLLEE